MKKKKKVKKKLKTENDQKIYKTILRGKFDFLKKKRKKNC